MRNGEIKKLPRSETHSSQPKLGFSEQDDGASFPGGITAKPTSQSSPPNATIDDEPPAYTVSEATEMVGGSGGPAGSLGIPAHQEQELKKRRVPPIPRDR